MTASPHGSWSTESFYSDLIAKVNLFTDLSRSYASSGRAEAAVTSQWGADVLTLQAVAWERIVVVSSAPQELLFAIGSRAIEGAATGTMHAAPEDLLEASSGMNPTAAGLIRTTRVALLSGIDEDLRSEVLPRLQALDHLETLRAPRSDELASVARARLAGMDPEAFIGQRRVDAAARMEDARWLCECMTGIDTTGTDMTGTDERPESHGGPAVASTGITASISAAYEADMLTVDAYLVESALAIGDTFLLTVQLRWDYASAAVTRLAGVPADVQEAVALVRRTLTRSLGPADGARLERSWLPID